MFSQDTPHAANADHLRTVYVEGGNGGTARCRQADDFGGVHRPRKMLGPDISLRMEQRHVLSRHRIAGRGAVSLGTVTCGTGQTEILKNCLTARRLRFDMLELEGDDRQLLRRVAICTAVCKLSANLSLKIDGNVIAQVPVAPAFWCRKVYLARVLTSVS